MTAGYALSQILPIGVFERFSVLAHSHKPDDYEHWLNGFYMKFGDVLICSSVLVVRKSSKLNVAARARKEQIDKLWRIMLRLLEVFYTC